MIAASVWIAPSIVKPSGAVSSRPSALTMPAVTVPWRPNGLPIATTRSPISSDSVEPRSSGSTPSGRLSSLSSATSVDGSASTTRAALLAVLEAHGHLLDAFDDVLVRGYVAFVVDHEAAARRAAAVGRAEGRSLPAGRGRDVHDPAAGAVVDLVDRQVASGGGARDLVGGRHGRRGLIGFFASQTPIPTPAPMADAAARASTGTRSRLNMRTWKPKRLRSR